MSALLDTLESRRASVEMQLATARLYSMAITERGDKSIERALLDAGCPQLMADELARDPLALDNLLRAAPKLARRLSALDKRIAGLNRWLESNRRAS